MAAPVLPVSKAPNNWLATSTSGTTLTGVSTDYNQLAANTSNVTLVGGPLDDTFIVYDASDTIVQASGTAVDTVETWGSGYTLPTNVNNLTLEGSAAAYAKGNGANDLIIANSGADTITTGGGNDVIKDGSGADYIIPTQSANTTTWVTGFKTSGTVTDKLDLYGYGFKGFATVQAAMTQVGANVQINLGNRQSLVLANTTVASISVADVNVEPSSSNMHLTFDEEFNSLSLNLGTPATAGGVWGTTYSGNTRTLSRNNELETYVDPNYKGTSSTALGLNPYSVSNGVLTITAEPTPAADKPYISSPYVSGMLSTQNSFSQTYGYFEMSAELTGGAGMWPAFWMLPENNQWPPELDILEGTGVNTNFISSGVHSAVSGTQDVGVYVTPNVSTSFNTYAVSWTPQTMTWYFNGQQIFQTATPADLDTPMYMILDLAVGGTTPGSPNATTNWAEANMKVDWVRAYSYNPLTATPATITVGNAASPTDPANFSIAGNTGPGTSTTYTAAEMKLANVPSGATVTASFDANNNLTLTNNGAWNDVKNATYVETSNGYVTFNNFAVVEATIGNGDSQINVSGIKRGDITLGNGDDTVIVSALSNGTTGNVTNITTGTGNDTIAFSGANNTVANISAGNGTNAVTIGAQALATVKVGTGNNTITDNSTSAVGITASTGNNVFDFIAGVHATVTGYNASQDQIVLEGITASQFQVTNSGGSTLISLGSGSSILLSGVTATQNTLNISHA